MRTSDVGGERESRQARALDTIESDVEVDMRDPAKKRHGIMLLHRGQLQVSKMRVKLGVMQTRLVVGAESAAPFDMEHKLLLVRERDVLQMMFEECAPAEEDVTDTVVHAVALRRTSAMQAKLVSSVCPK
jgi:hypothetical protein